jgi:hypothetical protein
MEDKRTNLTTYNRSKQNWNIWCPTKNNTSWILLYQYQKWLMLTFTGFSRSYSCNFKLTDMLQMSKFPTYIHLNGYEPLVTQLQCISSRIKILLKHGLWGHNSEGSLNPFEPLTNSPLNAIMQCTSTPLIWKSKNLETLESKCFWRTWLWAVDTKLV